MSRDFPLSESVPFKPSLESKENVAPKKPSEAEQKVQAVALKHLEAGPSVPDESRAKKDEHESGAGALFEGPRETRSLDATVFLLSESPHALTGHSSFATEEVDLGAAASPKNTSPAEAKELTDDEIVSRAKMPPGSKVLRDTVQLITVVVGRVLGEGCFGKVVLAQDTSNHEAEALKLALPATDNVLEQEYQLLRTINPRGEVGIQLPPRQFVTLSSGSGKPEVGYLAPLYSGDLEAIDLASPAELRSGIFQLTSGLLRLGAQETVHGDIKPANMLARPGRYDLADLGSAKSMAQIQKWIENFFDSPGSATDLEQIVQSLWEGYTPAFSYKSEIFLTVEVLRSYYKKSEENPTYRKAIVEMATKDLFLIMKGRDAYALGQSLKEMTLPRDFRLKFINDPTANFDTLPKGRHTFFHMEGFTTEMAEKIHACLNGMTARKPVGKLSELREIYNERLRHLQELHDLMRAMPPLTASASSSA